MRPPTGARSGTIWCMLGGGSPITLFHVRGIRIAVDWSWFFVLFLVIFWLSQFYGDVLGESSSSTHALRARPAQRRRLLRLDRPARARPRVRRDAQRDRHLQHPALDLRRHGAHGPRVRPPVDRVQGRDRRPGGDPGDRRRPHRGRPRRDRPASEFGQAVAARIRAPASPASWAMVGWLASINAPRPRLQPAARLPDGRRPRRPRDRLVADRRPHRGDPLRRQPRPRLRLPLHRRRPRC